MAATKNELQRGRPADSVGIKVPAGRIAAGRVHWQTLLDARDKPRIYRIFNAPARGGAGNALTVEADGPRRRHRVDPGASIDVMGKTIRVRAGTGGKTATVEGWYVLVS